jgi:glycerol-3-phosphate dehydrogenase
VDFDANQREQNLERLASESFDLLVIGGGITGAGVALDAAGRGLRTALVERGDFAAGTSSRSSKLVHGGLRYLQQKEFRLVYEALAERQRLLRLAPHLVKPLPFLIPVFASGVAGLARARAYARGVGTALWMYDATGGARIGKLHKRLSKREALELMPDLDGRKLAAGFLYYDARVDDARLTLTVVKTAASLGAVVANRVEATGLRRESAGGRIDGAVLTDRLTGRRMETRAAVVINAAGVWADELRALDEGANPHSIRPAKGVHITLPAGRPALDIAAVLSVPGDRRSVFVVPWGDRIYVGTTDTDYDGPLDEPECTAADVDYLLGALNAWITKPVGRHEVLGTWAGLRPLVGGSGPAAEAAPSSKTADLSRRHSVRVAPSGLVTIVGGKLTTYRAMAEDTVDEAVGVIRRHRPVRVPDSRSGSTPLFGADGYEELTGPGAAERLGLPADVVAHLAGRFGGHTRAVAAMVRERPELGERLVPGLPYLKAEAVYAVRYEMALTLEDVLSRRTRALLLDAAASAGAATAAAALIGAELGWSDDERARQVDAFLGLVERQRRAADPAEDAVEARMLHPDLAPPVPGPDA